MVLALSTNGAKHSMLCYKYLERVLFGLKTLLTSIR